MICTVLHKTTPLLICALGLLASSAQANVVIGGTRVIYPANEREVSVRLSNEGAQPALTQAWVDQGDPDTPADQANAPFLITPPIARIEPGKGQALRLVHVPEALPQDRESLFWLNVLDVPPQPPGNTNVMQMAIRSRIKLFFRPAGLTGTPGEAAQQLVWQLQGKRLLVRNNSSYHVSFSNIELVSGNHPLGSIGGGMVAPASTSQFDLDQFEVSASGTAKVVFLWINDYGAAVQQTAPLSH